MNQEFALTDTDGEVLVKMARNTVKKYLETNVKVIDNEFNSKFTAKAGAFVTINKQNSLRGCIGYPLPIKKLSSAIVDAAIAAATEDPRFPPINLDEIDQIIFEVTVLSPPTEINVENYQDYLSVIKVGRDGLIVESSYKSGLLLPQVPIEYKWNVKEFLEHTCEKAGLDKHAWMDNDTKISKFEGITKLIFLLLICSICFLNIAILMFVEGY